MRVNELMIGDWVAWNNTPSRVHTITSAEQIRLSNSNELTELLYSHELDFEPIPLTVEILEKNGFYRYKYFDYNECIFFSFPDRMIMKRSGFGIEKRNNIYYITDHALMPMRYVHELQRALRSCDLWYFANNFKI